MPAYSDPLLSCLFLYGFQDTGLGKGRRYAVNVPLRDGIDDESYQNIFQPVGEGFLSLLCINTSITSSLASLLIQSSYSRSSNISWNGIGPVLLSYSAEVTH